MIIIIGLLMIIATFFIIKNEVRKFILNKKIKKFYKSYKSLPFVSTSDNYLNELSLNTVLKLYGELRSIIDTMTGRDNINILNLSFDIIDVIELYILNNGDIDFTFIIDSSFKFNELKEEIYNTYISS